LRRVNSYANNNPYKYTDPDGKVALALQGALTGTLVCGPVCGAIAGATLSIASYYAVDAIVHNESSGDAPAIPERIVGDQGSDEAGSNRSGKRHTSGTLTPENGGTGNYEGDLEYLAGETRPSVLGDSAPPGSQIGENGVYGRPKNSSGGRSIEIPGNGDKPHESLHYPPKK
jgi:filamentous hemagglutinin